MQACRLCLLAVAQCIFHFPPRASGIQFSAHALPCRPFPPREIGNHLQSTQLTQEEMHALSTPILPVQSIFRAPFSP